MFGNGFVNWVNFDFVYFGRFVYGMMCVSICFIIGFSSGSGSVGV